jgi:hypothetical protein
MYGCCCGLCGPSTCCRSCCGGCLGIVRNEFGFWTSPCSQKARLWACGLTSWVRFSGRAFSCPDWEYYHYIGLLFPRREFLVEVTCSACCTYSWHYPSFSIDHCDECERCSGWLQCIYRPLSGIGISYGIFYSLLCDFKPELWQVHLTILAYFCLILGFGSLNKCYTSETRSHNYG